MASRKHLVDDLQQLMATLRVARAATRPTPWLNVDLSMPQLKALMVLYHRGIVRAGEVARALGMSPNATTGVLDRLEGEGLARRQADPTDRRAVLVGLTEAGTVWITELLSANARDFAELLDQLSGSDLQALHQGMAALSRVLARTEAGKAATAEGARNQGCHRHGRVGRPDPPPRRRRENEPAKE